jgi:NADH dehydrogenase (ubiquinone) 1 alpha subcomplex subunit 9
MDVAQALTNILEFPSLPGLLTLPGPSTLTYEYLLALVSSVTYHPPSRAPVVPKAVATLLARLAQNVWWPALSPDQVERRYINDAEVPGDWDKVGVEPTEIEDNAILYLRRYRTAYVRPPARVSPPWRVRACVSLTLTFLPCRENFVRPVILPASRDSPVSVCV